MLANDLDRIGAGQAQYSMLCNDEGGVVDDLIVYRLNDDEVRIMPNAANAATVRDALSRRGLPEGVALADLHEAEGILAIQGPGCRDAHDRPRAAGRRRGPRLHGLHDWPSSRGTPAVVCRTGYTGEHGYELVVGGRGPARTLVAARRRGRRPAGSGARDTLRTEMGYPLHGQDLSPRSRRSRRAWLGGRLGQAGVRGAGGAGGPARGGPPRALRGLLLEGRGIPRAHMAVQRARTGRPRGETTSGTFSPTLKAGIALALVDPALAVGDEVAIDIRGRAVPARIVRLPFVESSPK